MKEVEKIVNPEEGLDPVKDYLRRIEECEKEDYQYYQPFKDLRTGKWVPVASPLYEEKRRLRLRLKKWK